MAPRRVQIVLAVEVAAPWRPTNCGPGDRQAYPRDEHCQSAVGSAADPWRTPQDRHRYRTDQRGQVHGQAKRPAIPRLEDVPSQSCRRHRRDGYVRRADNLISPALRLVDCGRGRRQIYGLASQRIRPQNGSQIRSRKPAAGNKLPAISFVTGTGPMVRSSSEGFDQWAFAIDRRRRALLGKMDMLKG